MPTFGICLGHQMLGLALGAKTMKMHQGHHGANHPVKDLTTGKVEITSMNHGFAVDRDTLPANVDGDPCLAVRRLQLRPRAQGQAGLLGAVSPRGLARPARQPLSVRALRRLDAGAQGAAAQTGVITRLLSCGLRNRPLGWPPPDVFPEDPSRTPSVRRRRLDPEQSEPALRRFPEGHRSVGIARSGRR